MNLYFDIFLIVKSCSSSLITILKYTVNQFLEGYVGHWIIFKDRSSQNNECNSQQVWNEMPKTGSPKTVVASSELVK